MRVPAVKAIVSSEAENESSGYIAAETVGQTVSRCRGSRETGPTESLPRFRRFRRRLKKQIQKLKWHHRPKAAAACCRAWNQRRNRSKQISWSCSRFKSLAENAQHLGGVIYTR